MKKFFLKKYNRILGIILSCLGLGSGFTFTGCEKYSPVEYGAPYAKYKVNGIVTDQNNRAIDNIKVTMGYDSSYTDENGNYNILLNESPSIDTFRVKFTDIDGNSNGSFENLDTLISFENIEFESADGSWYKGEKSMELNIKMKEQN